MTDNITALIAEARGWASGSPLGKITAREVDRGILFARRLADALEAEHKRAEGLLVDLDARFEHSDHTAAKYWRRMREAEQERDQAKRAAVTLGQVVDRHVEDTLRWAGMEDQIGTNDPDQQLAWELCAEMPGKIAALTAERDRYRAEAESARKTGERILTDALRYRTALERIDTELRGDGRSSVLIVIAQEIIYDALNEGAADV